jgi:DUF971 family protein
MAEVMYEPRHIELLEDGLEIIWGDGHRSSFPHRYLRGHCGCAQCVDEMTQQRKVGIEDVPADIQVEDFIEVGNYAVELLFSDLHYTGIYPFRLLRGLCNCPECELLREAEETDKGAESV